MIGLVRRDWFVPGSFGIARVVHGVHLPADLIGGWAFCTWLGLVGVSVIDRHRARQRATPARLP